MRCDKYILKGREVVPEPDILAWARWFENGENRRIANTEIGGITISTIFLSLDIGVGTEHPILFETMIFDQNFKSIDNYQQRYSTYEQAEQGHKKAVEKVRARLKQDKEQQD